MLITQVHEEPHLNQEGKVKLNVATLPPGGEKALIP